ncbi:hypothetical protein [Fusobacterium varium]|uniref:Rho termination factor N-terminal domain-containing protein n=1 Tax=Fusobacterium varium ATCC 27725 TaxID=469618 RepID=A0ABN5JEA5_FUSVA|nr:hypothetical protein [Fusobacterium varium]AVQ30337.1 hypothetical protein C4N18_03485 [Fusobacterium varium ATCC 27725]EES64628.1 hypothetical protein FVAG_01311 [Fusobacterium varium ATCC 27725]MCD7979658.1 hypothetical protein [Fusobacterium sp.]VEH37700.1 Uncharacterised protein [Fusobacterium varium]
MAKIICPNKEYTGVSASVSFCNGVGETEDIRLIKWFEDHGYTVVNNEKVVEKAAIDEKEKEEVTAEETATEKEMYTKKALEGMAALDIDELAAREGVDISNCKNKNEKIEKILEYQKAKEEK